MIKLRLNELLEEKDRTMYWLSKQSGVRYATIFNLCKGDAAKLRIETLDRICEALNCQPGDLLVREADSKRKTSTKSKKKAR
jgi:putative transcriptional regulator